jgi:2-keto-3-deoxy-L-rhamnonate aldolase RhmA
VSDIHQDLIKRALDMGAQGVLLPLVRSAEDVERGFRCGHYPPRGARGVGGERAVRWGLRFQEYLSAANEETLVVPIIETRDAVEDIDAILATPGLDAIFFGPADLSASYGYLGEWEGPGVAEEILRVRGLAEARGIAAGLLARSLEEARQRFQQGFRMVAVGSDTSLLIEALRGRLDALRA